MRKVISFILVLCLLTVVALPVFASEETAQITPRYSYIQSISGSVSVSSGTIQCVAQGKAYSATNKVQLNCVLYGKTSSGWSSMKSWSTIGTATTSLSKTATTSSEYSQYRLQITCKVYDSSYTLLESATVYRYS